MSEPMQHDDPRLTAYALGELDKAGMAEVEQWLAEHPEALAEIGDVREFSSQLQSAFQQEPAIAGQPGLEPAARSLVLAAGQTASARTQRSQPRTKRWLGWRMVTASTAASLLLLAGGSALSWKLMHPSGVPNPGGQVAQLDGNSRTESRFKSLPGDELARARSGDRSETSIESPDEFGLVAAPTITELSVDADGDSAPKHRVRGEDAGWEFEKLEATAPGKPIRLTTGPHTDSQPVAKSPGIPSIMEATPRIIVESEAVMTDEYFSHDSGGSAARGEVKPTGSPKSASKKPAPGKRQAESPRSGYYLRDDVQHFPAGSEFKLEMQDDALTVSSRQGQKQRGQKLAEHAEAGKPDSSRKLEYKNGQPAESKPGEKSPERLLGEEKLEQVAKGDGDQVLHESTNLFRSRAYGENQFGVRFRSETYAPLTEQVFQLTANAPLSTFALDVDTASYTNVRRFLRNGVWPPEGAIRVEEMVNYFRFADPAPTDNKPFAVSLEVAACPWQVEHQLVRIGIRARDIPRDQRRANLVFLLDVSGSMADANKLPLVKEAMKILTQRMTETDRVAIVTYSDTAKIALESTSGTNRDQITQVIESLRADGSTNGAGGIQLAYRIAAQNFIKKGSNRVLLCTDGDFNVGISDDSELVKLISEKSQSGVFLSVFGFGMGNLKDAKLEKLADKGNGHYGYIDDISEAQRVFVEQLDGTLYTVAKDVKTQVEFNRQQVSSYRLIGYENRAMSDQDFRNDAKDAGEIGSGHSVTVLYEIVPGAAKVFEAKTDDVPKELTPMTTELFLVRMRYKQPASDVATEEQFRYTRPAIAPKPSAEIQWAAGVAAFGMVLRNSPHKGQASLAMVQELAQAGKVEPRIEENEATISARQRVSHRQEFLELVTLAQQIQAPQVSEPVPVPVAVPAELGEKEALAKAAVDGKYKRLLEKIRFPEDLQTYGAFNDYGYWPGGSYAGQDNLPQSYWVYVYPNWFLWGDTTVKAPTADKN